MDDNKCSDLEVNNEFSDNPGDTLGMILSAQKRLQEDTYGYSFDSLSLKDVVDYMLLNNQALLSELNEIMDAIGGQRDPGGLNLGSAAWKPWKKRNSEVKSTSLNSLSESERKELVMEVVDFLHFFANMCAVLNIDSEELYNCYFAKRRENIDRQKRGY